MAVYLRWNTKVGISLAAMKRHRSQDFAAEPVIVRDARGFGRFEPAVRMPGLCATQDRAYIARIISEFGVWAGEVLEIEADDTGARCMDGHPAVKPRAILSRTPAAEWMEENFPDGVEV